MVSGTHTGSVQLFLESQSYFVGKIQELTGIICRTQVIYFFQFILEKKLCRCLAHLIYICMPVRKNIGRNSNEEETQLGGLRVWTDDVVQRHTTICLLSKHKRLFSLSLFVAAFALEAWTYISSFWGSSHHIARINLCVNRGDAASLCGSVVVDG